MDKLKENDKKSASSHNPEDLQKKVIKRPIIRKFEPPNPEILKNIRLVFNSDKIKQQLKTAVGKLQADDALQGGFNIDLSHMKFPSQTSAKSHLLLPSTKTSKDIKDALRTSILQKNVKPIIQDTEIPMQKAQIRIGSRSHKTPQDVAKKLDFKEPNPLPPPHTVHQSISKPHTIVRPENNSEPKINTLKPEIILKHKPFLNPETLTSSGGNNTKLLITKSKIEPNKKIINQDYMKLIKNKVQIQFDEVAKMHLPKLQISELSKSKDIHLNVNKIPENNKPNILHNVMQNESQIIRHSSRPRKISEKFKEPEMIAYTQQLLSKEADVKINSKNLNINKKDQTQIVNKPNVIESNKSFPENFPKISPLRKPAILEDSSGKSNEDLIPSFDTLTSYINDKRQVCTNANKPTQPMRRKKVIPSAVVNSKKTSNIILNIQKIDKDKNIIKTNNNISDQNSIIVTESYKFNNKNSPIKNSENQNLLLQSDPVTGVGTYKIELYNDPNKYKEIRKTVIQSLDIPEVPMQKASANIRKRNISNSSNSDNLNQSKDNTLKLLENSPKPREKKPQNKPTRKYNKKKLSQSETSTISSTTTSVIKTPSYDSHNIWNQNLIKSPQKISPQKITPQNITQQQIGHNLNYSKNLTLQQNLTQNPYSITESCPSSNTNTITNTNTSFEIIELEELPPSTSKTNNNNESQIVDAVDFICQLGSNYNEYDDNISEISSSIDDNDIINPEEFYKNVSESIIKEEHGITEYNNIQSNNTTHIQSTNYQNEFNNWQNTQFYEPVQDYVEDQHIFEETNTKPIVIENKILSENEKINLDICFQNIQQYETINTETGFDNNIGQTITLRPTDQFYVKNENDSNFSSNQNQLFYNNDEIQMLDNDHINEVVIEEIVVADDSTYVSEPNEPYIIETINDELRIENDSEILVENTSEILNENIEEQNKVKIQNQPKKLKKPTLKTKTVNKNITTSDEVNKLSDNNLLYQNSTTEVVKDISKPISNELSDNNLINQTVSTTNDDVSKLQLIDVEVKNDSSKKIEIKSKQSNTVKVPRSRIRGGKINLVQRNKPSLGVTNPDQLIATQKANANIRKSIKETIDSVDSNLDKNEQNTKEISENELSKKLNDTSTSNELSEFPTKSGECILELSPARIYENDFISPAFSPLLPNKIEYQSSHQNKQIYSKTDVDNLLNKESNQIKSLSKENYSEQSIFSLIVTKPEPNQSSNETVTNVSSKSFKNDSALNNKSSITNPEPNQYNFEPVASISNSKNDSISNKESSIAIEEPKQYNYESVANIPNKNSQNNSITNVEISDTISERNKYNYESFPNISSSKNDLISNEISTFTAPVSTQYNYESVVKIPGNISKNDSVSNNESSITIPTSIQYNYESTASIPSKSFKSESISDNKKLFITPVLNQYNYESISCKSSSNTDSILKKESSVTISTSTAQYNNESVTNIHSNISQNDSILIKESSSNDPVQIQVNRPSIIFKVREIQENDQTKIKNNPEENQIVKDELNKSFTSEESRTQQDSLDNQSDFVGFDHDLVKAEDSDYTFETVESTLLQPIIPDDDDIPINSDKYFYHEKSPPKENLKIKKVSEKPKKKSQKQSTQKEKSQKRRKLDSDSDNFDDEDCIPLKKRPIRPIFSSSSASESERNKKDTKIVILDKHEYYSSRSDTPKLSGYESTDSKGIICNRVQTTPKLDNVNFNKTVNDIFKDESHIKNNKLLKPKRKRESSNYDSIDDEDNLKLSDIIKLKTKKSNDSFSLNSSVTKIKDESKPSISNISEVINISSVDKNNDSNSVLQNVNSPNISTINQPKKRGRKPKIKLNDSVPVEKKPIKSSEQKPWKRGRKKVTEARILHPRLLLCNSRTELDNTAVSIAIKENLSKDEVQCGFCYEVTLKPLWNKHLSTHYGIGWKVGEPKIDVTSFNDVLQIIVAFIKNTEIKSLKCRMCNKEMKSALGILTHVEGCNLTDEEKREKLYAQCEYCEGRFHYLSLPVHVKSCPVLREISAKEIMEKKEQETVLLALADPTFSNTGRIKRQSTVKAENKFKEIEEVEKQNAELDVFNFIRSVVPIRGIVFQKWKQAIESGNVVNCPAENCHLKFDNYNTLRLHVKICENIIKSGYRCSICKHRDPLCENIRKHILKAHKNCMGNDFNPSESEVEFSNDESSESEDISSGVDENEENETIKDDDEVEADGEDYGKTKTKEPAKRKQSDKISTTYKFKNLIGQERHSHYALQEKCRKWTKEFLNVNYTTDTLFPSCIPKESQISSTLLSDYEPHNHLSMKFSFSNEKSNKSFGTSAPTKWMELKKFNSMKVKDEIYLFIGGPISSIDWLPMPENINNTSQYLAISYKSDYNKYIRVINPKSYKTLLVIYEVGSMENFNNTTTDDSTGKLLYGITIDRGPINDMKFLPSGGYDTNINRLGLLAVATIDNTIDIYSLPIKAPQNCDSNNDKFNLIQLEPCMKLTMKLGLNDADILKKKIQYFVQCTKIVWSKAKGHNMIVSGYANGYVAIWNIDTEDNLNCFVIDDILQFAPLNYFRVNDKCISDIDLHYDANGLRWLIASCQNRILRIFDIEDPTNPIVILEELGKSLISSVTWPLIWENPSYGVNADLGIFPVTLLSPMQLYFAKRRGARVSSGVTCLDFNSSLNTMTVGTDNGDLAIEINAELNLEVSKKFLDAKLFSYTDLIRLDGDQPPLINPVLSAYMKRAFKPKVRNKNIKQELIDEQKNEIFDNSKKDSLKFFDKEFRSKYGLVFGPISFWREENPIISTVNRCPPFNMTCYIRINSTACNNNLNGLNFYAFGYENGFVRIICKKIPIVR